jgi:hypothetical protein
MNDVQRNFKRQMKQIESHDKRYWRKERYYDRFQKKHFVRYFDEHDTLLKTAEIKRPFIGLLKVIIGIITVCIILAIILFIYTKFHILVF